MLPAVQLLLLLVVVLVVVVTRGPQISRQVRTMRLQLLGIRPGVVIIAGGRSGAASWHASVIGGPRLGVVGRPCVRVDWLPA